MKKEFSLKEKNEYIFILNLLSFLFEKKEKVVVPENINFKTVYRIAAENCISNMLSYAVSKLQVDIPSDMMKGLVYKQKFMLMKDASQFAATERLINAFEKNGIDNLLVKGQFIKDCYSQPDYRFMSDVDIHIHTNDLPKIKKIVADLDFKISVETENLMIIYQEPFVEVELHGDNGMYDDTVFGENLFFSAVLKEGKNYTYEFSPENHYVYIVEHFAKHFRDLGGMGIRMMTDMYMLHRMYQDKINTEYVYKKLRASGTFKFHRMLLSKCIKYFEQGMNKDNFDIVDIFILTSGVFGTSEVLTYNKRIKYEKKYFDGKENDSSNEKYILRRLFPPAKRMAEDYPSVNQTKLVLPFVWAHRGLKIAFSKDRKKYAENIARYKKYNKNSEIQYLKEAMKKAGF